MTESDIYEIVRELKSIQINQNELKNKVDSIHQGLYGLPDTDDKGFCGELKRMMVELKELKDQIRKIIMAVCFIAGGGGISAAIIKLVGG